MQIVKYIKIVISVLLVFSCSVMFTGCWDKRELNELAIVLGVAVDRGTDGKILLTAQIAKSSSNQGGTTGGDNAGDYSNIAYEGEFVLDTLRRMTTMSSRQMYNSHNQLILIEKELAKDGVYDYIDFFARDNEFRYTMWLVIADGKAADVLDAKTQYDNVPTTELSQLIEMQSINSLNVQTTVLDFVKSMSDDSASVLLPIVHLEENGNNSGEEQSGGQESGSQNSGGSGESIEQSKKNKETEQHGKGNSEKNLKISRAAVMKDNKLVGEISEQEIRGYLWCKDKVKSTILVVSSESCSGNVEVFRSKCGYKAKINNDGSITVTVNVRAEGMLNQLKGGYNKSGKDLLNQMEESCCSLIRQEILQSFEAAKKYNADFIGVSNYLDKYCHSEWQQYKNTEHGQSFLQNIKVVTEIETVIEGTGALNVGEDIID